MNNNLRITLFDRNKSLCTQWENDFQAYENINVVHTDFENLPAHDCIVSPANSFGLMDGGFDLVLRDYFDDIQNKVQAKINEIYNGIQPIGTSLIIKTGDLKFPCLAHTPTMIVPTDISNTIHVFLAFRSILYECKKHNIKSLACNGLGYGIGKMSAENVSRQMKKAYDIQGHKFPNWDEVIEQIFPISSIGREV